MARPPLRDARGARNGRATGIPGDARQYATRSSIHPSRKMRRQHASTGKKVSTIHQLKKK